MVRYIFRPFTVALIALIMVIGVVTTIGNAGAVEANAGVEAKAEVVAKSATTPAGSNHTTAQHCFMAAVALLNFYPQVGLIDSGRTAIYGYDWCYYLRTGGTSFVRIYYYENDWNSWSHVECGC